MSVPISLPDCHPTLLQLKYEDPEGIYSDYNPSDEHARSIRLFAKSIIDQHKGKTYAKSVVGESTTFYVQLSYT
ncbi:hypothetical protein ACE3NQ_15560 [Paenibacillus terreus]|uniref:Uncharacterized protein n=1 Tax=Paenibacillus terreus TaxID=1387834 RepID=A0ABV5B9H2_9BACL